MIKNLRDFLSYLEAKDIINQNKLQDKEEMKNLIKDIMKLDLTKFSKPRSNSLANSKVNSNVSSVPNSGLQSVRMKKRKVHASPNPETVARSVPTQQSIGASSGPFQAKVIHQPYTGKIVKTTISKETSPSQPIHSQSSPQKKFNVVANYGMAPHERVVSAKGKHGVVSQSVHHSKMLSKASSSQNSSQNFILPGSSGSKARVNQNVKVSGMYPSTNTNTSSEVYGVRSGKHTQASPSEDSKQNYSHGMNNLSSRYSMQNIKGSEL